MDCYAEKATRAPNDGFLKYFENTFLVITRGEGGGRCLQGNLWYSPPASMTSRLATVTFKTASKVSIEETDENFDFIMEILFRFLGFGDFKVSIVYRWANFTGNHTDWSHFWGPVHTEIEKFRHSNRRFIKGCTILYIVRIFSSSELVKPHIIPLKVRLAVALKDEAKWQVIVRDCEHWILLLYRILILYWAYTCNSVIKSRKPIKRFV